MELRLAISAVSLLAVATAPGPAATSVTGVAHAAPRTLGEPAVAVTGTGTVLAATSFLPNGSVVRVYSRPGVAGRWSGPAALASRAYPHSYDADAAAGAHGTALVVTGASSQGCIFGGVVQLWTVRPGAPPALTATVDTPAGGGFDDRPGVAAAPDGTVAVTWSRGSAAAACDVVGRDDAVELAVSHDGGRHFAVPVRLSPPVGAFGARPVLLSGGRVAVAWVQPVAPDRSAVELATVAGRSVSRTRLATFTPLPLVLPGASFYAFTAPSLTALGGDRLAVGWPAWTGQAAVLQLAVGTAGGGWRTGSVRPPAGADLLLPDVQPIGPDRLLVVGTEHRRATDATSLVDAEVSAVAPAPSAGVRPVTTARPGPGFHEIGEVQLGAVGGGSVWVPAVLGGKGGANLVLLRFPVQRPSPSAARSSGGGSSGADPPASGSPTSAAGSAGGGPGPVGIGLVVAVIAVGGVLVASRAARSGRH